MKTLLQTYKESCKEFEKLTPDSFDIGNYNNQENWLKDNPHLFTGHMYDEPAYTLDKNKILSFLKSHTIAMIEGEIDELKNGESNNLGDDSANGGYWIATQDQITYLEQQLKAIREEM